MFVVYRFLKPQNINNNNNFLYWFHYRCTCWPSNKVSRFSKSYRPLKSKSKMLTPVPMEEEPRKYRYPSQLTKYTTHCMCPTDHSCKGLANHRAAFSTYTGSEYLSMFGHTKCKVLSSSHINVDSRQKWQF